MTQYYTGCSGWSYKSWKKNFYPANLRSDQWLRFYATRFKTVEVNMSFYRTPSLDLLAQWQEQTPDNFRFSFKAPRLITHRKKFRNAGETGQRFMERMDSIHAKTDFILWQLPPSFHFCESHLARIESFFTQLSSNHFGHAVEFRHRSWWNEQTYHLLTQLGLTFCVPSCPDLSDEMVVTSPVGYIRFHGARQWYDDCYSRQELQSWAARINASKLKKAYIYFNNDVHAYAPENARIMMTILNRRFG